MNRKIVLIASILIIGKTLLNPQRSFADISDLTNDNLNKFSTKNTYTDNINTINNIPLTDNSASFINNASTSLPTFYFEDQNNTTLQAIPQDMPMINPIKNTDTGINKISNSTVQTMPQNMPAPIQNNTDNNTPEPNNIVMQVIPQNAPLISPAGNNTDTGINKTSDSTVQTIPQNMQSMVPITNSTDNIQPKPPEINADSEVKPPPIPNEIKTNLRILKNNYYLVKPLTANSVSYQQEKKQKINAAPETITPTVIDDTPRVMIYQPPGNNTAENNYPVQSNTQQNSNLPENQKLYTGMPAKDMPGENTPYENSQLSNSEFKKDRQGKNPDNQTNAPYTKAKNKHASGNPALNILKTIVSMLIKCALILAALAIMGLLLHAFRSSFNGNIS